MERQEPRRPSSRRIIVIVLTAAVLALLAAVAMIVVPILTHQSAGGSGQTQPVGFVSAVTATGDDGRTRVLEVLTQEGAPADLSSVAPGDLIVVRGSGYDADIGIYVGICRVPDEPTSRPTPCLGGIPEDAREEKDAEFYEQAHESAWVTSNWAWRSFASHSYLDTGEGTFEVLLEVPPVTTEGLDCRVDACGLFTRADHTAISDRVQDLYLPVAFE